MKQAVPQFSASRNAEGAGRSLPLLILQPVSQTAACSPTGHEAQATEAGELQPEAGGQGDRRGRRGRDHRAAVAGQVRERLPGRRHEAQEAAGLAPAPAACQVAVLTTAAATRPAARKAAAARRPARRESPSRRTGGCICHTHCTRRPLPSLTAACRAWSKYPQALAITPTPGAAASGWGAKLNLPAAYARGPSRTDRRRGGEGALPCAGDGAARRRAGVPDLLHAPGVGGARSAGGRHGVARVSVTAHS
jgi:hypothetical protein